MTAIGIIKLHDEKTATKLESLYEQIARNRTQLQRFVSTSQKYICIFNLQLCSLYIIHIHL